MRNNFLIAIAMLLLFVTSCKKDEKLNSTDNYVEQSSSSNHAELIEEAYANLTTEEKKFFTPSYLTNTIKSMTSPFPNQEQTHAGGREELDPIVNQVLEKVLLLNDGDSFASTFMQEFGFPAWDMAILETTEDEDGVLVNIVHIPFAFPDGTELTSYLFAIIDANQKIEFAHIKRSVIDPILEAQDIDFDISYHVFVLLNLEYNLLGNLNQSYFDWLQLFSGSNIQGTEVTVRGCTLPTTICMDIITLHDPNQVETREWGCFETFVYYEDCVGSTGTGSGGVGSGGSIGNGSTNTSGGIGGSSGNDGGNNDGTPTFENILEFCGITGDEGPGEGYQLTELQIKACNALDYLESIEFPQENINYLTDIDHINLIIQIANYIEQGGAYELSLATDYISMLINGTTSLGSKQFKKLYKLVVQELKPILSSNEAEDDFLLENPNVANQIKDFLDENPDLEVANFEVINGVAFLVDSDGVLHIFIEPLDMYQSNDLEKLNHVLNVLNLVKIYHCEYSEWYPIDWTDYLVQTTSPHFVVDWISPQYNVITIGMNLDFTLASQPEHYLMGTSPDYHYTITGTGNYKFSWNRLNSGLPMLSIVVPEIYTGAIESILYPSECD